MALQLAIVSGLNGPLMTKIPKISFGPVMFLMIFAKSQTFQMSNCLSVDVAVQLPDKKSIIMYVTSLFAVLPNDITMDDIREVETLPRKFRVESEEAPPPASLPVVRKKSPECHCVKKGVLSTDR